MSENTQITVDAPPVVEITVAAPTVSEVVITGPDTVVVDVGVNVGGPPGPRGFQGQVSVVNTITGAPGTMASVTDSDPSDTTAALTFTIPRGDKGEASVVPGPPGTPAEVSVVSTTTGAPGTMASVTDSDPSPNKAALVFTIPRGDTGSKGDKGDPGQGIPAGGNPTEVLTKKSGTDYDTEWKASSGGSGSAAPGLIILDDMSGSTDDEKLDNAIALAKSYSTMKPAIAFGARRYDFTVSGRQVYSGMKFVGLAGQGSQQRAANSIPNDIRYNGTGVWWVVPPGQTFDVHMSGLSFQGNSNAQFMSSNPGVLWTSVFEDLGFNLWKNIFGNPSDVSNTKFLNTACKWLGYFNINNSYGTACTFGGSDSEFFLDGALIDSPTDKMPAGDYHLIFDYQEKSGCGPIYNTAERASGVKIAGGSTTTGLVLYGMGRVEGRNKDAPTHGSSIRITGGGVTIRDWWVAYAASALNTNGHSGEGGVITQTGGDVLYDGLWYDRATGVAESVPFIYVSGGKARVRNIRTGTKGGAWTGKPIVATAGSGTVVMDDSVTAATGVTMTDTLSIINSNRLLNALRINRTDPAQSTTDKDIFVIYYGSGTTDAERGTWVNEKGQLRTSNQAAKGEVAMKIIAALQAEGGSSDLVQIIDLAGNNLWRVGTNGRMVAHKGMRLSGGTFEIQDDTLADTTTIAQATGGDLLIVPKNHLSMGGKKIKSIANGTAANDAAAFGQIPTSLPVSGTAGGDLSGTYPNPDIKAGVIVDADINASAAIAQSKISGLTTALSDRVLKAGDKMTGNLEIETANPTLVLDTTDATSASGYPEITWLSAGRLRWGLRSSGTESGAATDAGGADMRLIARNNDGSFRSYPLAINRSTGLVTLNGDPTVALGAATKQYADAREAAANQYTDKREAATAATPVQDWNDTIAPGPLKQLMLGSWANGPGTAIYYYLTNYTYGVNLTQYAVPYSQTPTQPVRMRSYYSSTGWTRWAPVGDPGTMPVRAGTVRVLSRASDPIANNTPVSIVGGWTTITGDSGNVSPLVYNAGVITIGESGFYDITVYIQWAAGTAGGLRRVELLQNGTATFRDDRAPATPTAFSPAVLAINSMYLSATDTLQVAVLQQSGATMNINNGRWHVRKVASVLD